MRVAFYTFGCRLNQAETAIIEQGFLRDGHEVVDHRESPEVLVVNTCTVTDNGDADTRRLVRKISSRFPEVKIALVGCQAQVQKAALLELPNVRWVVGNARKLNLADIVAASGEDVPQLITPAISRDSFTIPFVGYDSRHTRANLKIQDGCDFFCSFCEIPFARGRARSRELPDILAEAQALTAAGHHELILTGINIGTYNYQGSGLVEVIDALEALPGLWRLRISSIEPTTIPDALIERMRSGSKLCRYLHVPLQAGSDAVLRDMRRVYSVQDFCNFVQQVAQAVPGVCLGTDVIAGFPGETDAHFEETLALLEDLPLAYFHVFSYSDRDHARSSRLPQAEKIAPEVISRRSRLLRELSDRKRRIYHRKYIGETHQVLFEGQKNGVWNGVTDTFVRVLVESGLDLKNRLLPVTLQRLDKQNLHGELAAEYHGLPGNIPA